MALIALLCFLLALTAPNATAACDGDCGDDGEVTIDELILGIDIALGRARVDRCPSIDADGDGNIAVDEIVGAVDEAVNGCPPPEPRLIAFSRDGHVASLEIAPPWTVRASGDLRNTVASARCRAGRCLVVHPAPADSISIVDASDLSNEDPIALERGADPRDVALVDDRTAVISQYGRAELLVLDLVNGATDSIDLGALADADGLPEALRLASCGRRVFVQLRRVDHETDTPAPIGGGLGVIDLDRSPGDRVVDTDPKIPGIQAIALAGRPNFDMPVDCEAGVLYVAEPAPLFQGGGGYEQIDLAALTASDLPIDTGAQVGGFEVVGPDQYWIITHTDIGPGPSSHLNFIGGSVPDTYNTFALEHIDDLAFDRAENLLFFPDACFTGPTNPSCDSGIQVFRADTGERLTTESIDLGFAPIEVVISR